MPCCCDRVLREPSGALHLANDRVRRAVSVLRRAAVAQARVWLCSKAFQERCSKRMA